MKKLQPLSDYVIVEVDPYTSSTFELEDGVRKSGLLVAAPEIQGIPNNGTILFTNPKEKFFKPGMKIVFDAGDPPMGLIWEGKKIMRIEIEKIGGIIQ